MLVICGRQLGLISVPILGLSAQLHVNPITVRVRLVRSRVGMSQVRSSFRPLPQSPIT